MASGGQQQNPWSEKDPDQDPGTGWKRSDIDTQYQEDSEKIPRSSLDRQHFGKSLENMAGLEHDMTTSRINKLKHCHSDLEHCPMHDQPIDEDLEPEERECEQRQRQRCNMNLESSDHETSTGPRLGGQIPYELAQSLPNLSQASDSGAIMGRGRGRRYQGEFRGRGHPDNFRGRGHPDNFRGRGHSDNFRGRGHSDNFRGRGHPDNFRGRGHPDNIRGRGHPDNFRGRGHPDNIRGRGHPDNFRGRGHPDNIRGRGHPDNIRGRGHPDNFRGGGHSDNYKGEGFPGNVRGRGHDSNYRGRGHDSNYRGRGQDSNYRGRGQDSHFRGRGHPGNFRGKEHECNIRGFSTRTSPDNGGIENETVNMSDEDNIGSSEDEDPKHKDIQQEDLIQWYDNQIEQKDGKAQDEMGKEPENSQVEQEEKVNNPKNAENEVKERRKPKNTESESEDFARGIVAKEQYVLLYVSIHQHIGENYDVKPFLQARMESGKEFRFKVLNLEHVNGQTVITLEFQSKKTASSAANLLKLSNQGSQMKLVCTFIRAEAMDQAAAKDEEELKKQLTAITKRAGKALANHEEKVKLTDMKIKSLSTNKHVSLDEFEEKRIEKEALNDKLTEMQKQKDQFTSFMKNLVKKLTEVWQETTNTKPFTDLRREFGVECCRLENALPMYARRNDIIRTVKENQVSVILGETGSGKSTQMTQYLHQAGFSQNGIIVCTQPRKVAAISLATHVSSEMATNVGNVVGYKVGMKAKLGGATKILYMTDHCLLNECLKDPSLSAYSCVIVDEAHERSIYTDLLLGMLKMCLKQRPELKAIITSATIDPDVFVHYFGGPQVCPVLKVSGRMFPVDVIYESDEDGQTFDKYIDAAVTKVVSVHKDEAPGDVLVFVTTPLETERCREMVQKRLQGRMDYKCLILHGQVQPEEQQLVFQASPPGMRKIVFATNSAETSITIPGIKYVIDTGLVKEKRYDPRRNMSSLNIVVISCSSADQRKGRAGRTGPGRCYRLYSEQLYKDMETVSQPEILRVHLGQSMLKLVELGINPLQYDFVQSPGQSAIATAMETLEELGAVKDNKITDDGRELAKLPLEPRLGLLIQKGRAEGAFFDAIVLAAVSSMGSSIFYRGGSDENKKKADKLKVQFCHSGGDSLTLLNIYRQWIVQPEKQKTKWCFDNSINSKTIKGARDSINEITTVLKKESKVTVKHELQEPKTVDEKLQKILFDCYVSNICHYLGHVKTGYYAARLDQQVHAHPSTVLNLLDIKPVWLVFEQSLKTSKDFITGLTPVDEPWVVQAVESGRLKRNLEDIRNTRLVPVHIEHVGSQIFWKIVGPCFTKLKKFEAIASDLVKPALAVIEASREKGELKVFSSDHSTEKLSHLFQSLVDAVKESLLEEDMELPLSQNNENAGIRVVLGPGGAVRNILMPDEYRTIFVEKPDENSSEDTILLKFSEYGKIKHHKVFKNKKTGWGCLTFESAEDAKKAVQATKDDQAEVAVCERRERVYQNTDFKVKITWCRRASKGLAFADLAPEEIPKILQVSSLIIKEHVVMVNIDKKTGQSLCLRKLGPDVMEEDIKNAILKLLGYEQDDADIIKKVTVVREKVDKEDTNQIKSHLVECIKKYAPENRFKLEVLEPKPATVTFRAFATFTNADEGMATCQGLSGKIYVGNKVVTMEPEIRSSLYINKEVYAAVKDDLDAYLNKFPTTGFSEVKVQSKVLKNGTIVLNVEASSTLELAKVRKNLQEIVQGDVLECGTFSNLRHLFTRAGRDFLKDAEKKYGVFIQTDDRNLTISIRGKQSACSILRTALSDYLRDFVEGEWREVSLRGRGKPNGLMKMLMNEYGLELENLQQEAGLRSVVLNFKQQIVKMNGSSENIDKATSIIDSICSRLQQGIKVPNPEDEELPDCCVCFCPVEAKDLYRMEYCGHAYCLDCVKRQVECALNDRELPLQCGQEGCTQKFMWKDITNLSRQGSCTMSTLATASVSSFVIANTKSFKYCLTPNCGMVYRVTSTGDVFQCPECTMKICTSCHVQYHEGLTCAMYLKPKEDESIDVFLAANSEKIKKCPSCSTPIEKNDGCNRMTCRACNCSFCWLCLAHFKDSGSCYDHLSKEHGGFF